MTTVEMSAELFRQLSIITKDKGMMSKLLKYAKKLTAEKQEDSLMTKEEFMEKIDRAEQQIARGEGMELLPGENLEDFLKRNGYDI